jgi:hypothetical protein
MFVVRTLIATAVLLFSACSALAPKDPDLTPINPSAVLEMHTVSAGTPDFPAFESTTLSYTRASMQRNETILGATGVVARLLDGNPDIRIERLDRKLAWLVDTKSKKVVECSLKVCPGAAGKPPMKKSADDQVRGTACRLKISSSMLVAEPTGRKRNINGFDTDQYDVKWQVTLRDNASRRSISTVSIDVWTTPVTPDLTAAMSIERTYSRAREKILGTDSDGDPSAVVPAEVGRMMSSYLSSRVSPTERANLLASARKLDKVKGQPILTNVKWTLAGEACSMDEAMKDIGYKPLFTFTSEVKTHKMQPLHDSLFVPSRGYTITK